ncbi:hypothetical protein GCM10009691_21440 [Brevibacterium picturae]|uniref:Transposase n=1 Tax=Brevibacterium picturae TaxID=260553 RepID=A0ABP4MLB7_9MICO
MTAARRRFSQEFKDELCQEVISTSKPIRSVAEAYGVGAETLRNWMRKYREAHGSTEEELTVSERARLKELERENHELRAETAFLKKASLDSNRQGNTSRHNQMALGRVRMGEFEVEDQAGVDRLEQEPAHLRAPATLEATQAQLADEGGEVCSVVAWLRRTLVPWNSRQSAAACSAWPTEWWAL